MPFSAGKERYISVRLFRRLCTQSQFWRDAVLPPQLFRNLKGIYPDVTSPFITLFQRHKSNYYPQTSNVISTSAFQIFPSLLIRLFQGHQPPRLSRDVQGSYPVITFMTLF